VAFDIAVASNRPVVEPLPPLLVMPVAWPEVEAPVAADVAVVKVAAPDVPPLVAELEPLVLADDPVDAEAFELATADPLPVVGMTQAPPS
jgi:hypothetical protein